MDRGDSGAGVGNGPASTIYDTAAWRAVVCDSYGFVDRSVKVDGAELPLFLTRSPLLGRKLSSAVFNSYASPSCGDERRCGELVAAGLKVAAEERVDWLEIKAVRPLPAAAARGLERRESYLRTCVELGSRQQVEANLDGKFRRQLRALRRQWQGAGVRLEPSTDADDVRAFHDLWVRQSRDRHAMVAQPWSFVRRLWHELGPAGAVELWVVRDREDRVVAGCLFGIAGDVATGMFSATAPELRRLSVDTLMKVDVMLSYAERGLRWLDLGVSSPRQSGLQLSKARFGGRTEPLPYYVKAIRAAAVPHVDYSDAYPWLRAPFRWLPTPAAKLVGEAVVRFLN